MLVISAVVTGRDNKREACLCLILILKGFFFLTTGCDQVVTVGNNGVLITFLLMQSLRKMPNICQIQCWTVVVCQKQFSRPSCLQYALIAANCWCRSQFSKLSGVMWLRWQLTECGCRCLYVFHNRSWSCYSVAPKVLVGDCLRSQIRKHKMICIWRHVCTWPRERDMRTSSGACHRDRSCALTVGWLRTVEDIVLKLYACRKLTRVQVATRWQQLIRH